MYHFTSGFTDYVQNATISSTALVFSLKGTFLPALQSPWMQNLNCISPLWWDQYKTRKAKFVGSVYTSKLNNTRTQINSWTGNHL